jgi:hypothetical protein
MRLFGLKQKWPTHDRCRPGREVLDRRAVPREQRLGKVPVDVAGVELGLGVLPDGIGLGPVDVRLAGEREGDAIGGRAEGGDLVVVSCTVGRPSVRKWLGAVAVVEGQRAEQGRPAMAAAAATALAGRRPSEPSDSPGSCCLNWLEGKPMMTSPSDSYRSWSCWSCLYCGVLPHWEATLTIRTTLPLSELKSSVPDRRGVLCGRGGCVSTDSTERKHRCEHGGATHEAVECRRHGWREAVRVMVGRSSEG